MATKMPAVELPPPVMECDRCDASAPFERGDRPDAVPQMPKGWKKVSTFSRDNFEDWVMCPACVPLLDAFMDGAKFKGRAPKTGPEKS